MKLFIKNLHIKFIIILLFNAFFAVPLTYPCVDDTSFFDESIFIEEGNFDGVFYIFFSPDSSENKVSHGSEYENYVHQIRSLEKSKGIKYSVVEELDERIWGSPVASNSYGSALQFLSAAFNDPNVVGDWQELIKLRHAILFLRDGRFKEETLKEIQKLNTKRVGGYKDYLEAAYYFYTGNNQEALSLFRQLKNATPPSPTFLSKVLVFLGLENSLAKKKNNSWLQEAATYMEARTLLIMSQQNLGGYEDAAETKAKLKLDLLYESRALFQAYLQNYPQGLYVKSAQNLQRKFHRLLGEDDKLNENLRDTFHQVLSVFPKTENALKFIYQLESEFRYFSGDIKENDDPIIMAYFILERDNADYAEQLHCIHLQEQRFNKYPGLFPFLKAFLLSKIGRYKELVSSIPESQNFEKNDSLSLSTEALRAQAFLHLGKPEKALEVLHKIKNVENDHFDILLLKAHRAHKSPLTDIVNDLTREKVLEVFIGGMLTQNELEILFQERHKISADTIVSLVDDALMRRYLVTGNFTKALEFEKNSTQTLEGVKDHMIRLLADPDHNQSLLEIGKYLLYMTPVRENVVRTNYDEIEKECLPIITIPFIRPVDYLLKIVENHAKSGKRSMIEAEALHYLIAEWFRSYKYQFIRYENDYDSYEHMKKNKVKHWFRRLHTVYKGSIWARETLYYY